MSDGLIDEATAEAARQRALAADRAGLQRRVHNEEPHLYFALSRFAVEALGGVEGCPLEAQQAAFDAVWRAAVATLDAYRVAYYRLWRKTSMGSLLEQLDPTLRGADQGNSSTRRRGGGAAERGDSGSGGDGGAADGGVA